VAGGQASGAGDNVRDAMDWWRNGAAAGVFDPPPPHLFVPSAYLAALGGVTCGAVVAAGTGVIRALRRPAADIIRDL